MSVTSRKETFPNVILGGKMLGFNKPVHLASGERTTKDCFLRTYTKSITVQFAQRCSLSMAHRSTAGGLWAP